MMHDVLRFGVFFASSADEELMTLLAPGSAHYASSVTRGLPTVDSSVP